MSQHSAEEKNCLWFKDGDGTTGRLQVWKRVFHQLPRGRCFNVSFPFKFLISKLKLRQNGDLCVPGVSHLVLFISEVRGNEGGREWDQTECETNRIS